MEDYDSLRESLRNVVERRMRAREKDRQQSLHKKGPKDERMALARKKANLDETRCDVAHTEESVDSLQSSFGKSTSKRNTAKGPNRDAVSKKELFSRELNVEKSCSSELLFS